MYSFPQRAGVLFAFAVSLGLLLAALTALSSAFLPAKPGPIQVELYNIAMQKASDGHHKHRVTDSALFRFAIRADFAPLFNWNVKEIFVYLVIEYENAHCARNEIFLWDKIVTQDDAHAIDIDNLGNKYPIVDFGERLGNADAVLKLKWNTVPWMGGLFDMTHEGMKEFRFPASTGSMSGGKHPLSGQPPGAVPQRDPMEEALEEEGEPEL